MHVACRYGVAACLEEVTYHAVADSQHMKCTRSTAVVVVLLLLGPLLAGRNHTSVHECAAVIALVRPIRSRPLHAHWRLSSLLLLSCKPSRSFACSGSQLVASVIALGRQVALLAPAMCVPSNTNHPRRPCAILSSLPLALPGSLPALASALAVHAWHASPRFPLRILPFSVLSSTSAPLNGARRRDSRAPRCQ